MNGLADDFSGRVSHAQDAGLTTEEGRKLRRQGWLAVMLLVMRVADLVVIWLSGLAAYTGRFGLVEVPGLVMLALTFAVMMSAVVFSLGRAYSAGEADNFWASASRVLGQWALVCLLLIAAVFMSGVAESYSRGWAALWMTTAALGLVGVRAAGATLMRRARARGSMVTRVAIIGGDESGLQLHHYLKQQGKHIEVVGIYDDRFARLQDAARAQGVTLLGTAQDFLKRARYESVDCVVINLPWSSEHRVREMVEVLQELAIEVQICPEGLNFVVQSFPLLKNSIATTLGGLPMFSVSRRPLDGWGWLIKDIEDRILITLLAPLVLPLCLLIAIAIKFDSPGPVLFRQRRKGFNGREFMVYKFRSMRAADSVPTGVTKATLRDDPRVTFVGNILRRTDRKSVV